MQRPPMLQAGHRNSNLNQCCIARVHGEIIHADLHYAPRDTAPLGQIAAWHYRSFAALQSGLDQIRI